MIHGIIILDERYVIQSTGIVILSARNVIHGIVVFAARYATNSIAISAARNVIHGIVI